MQLLVIYVIAIAVADGDVGLQAPLLCLFPQPRYPVRTSIPHYGIFSSHTLANRNDIPNHFDTTVYHGDGDWDWP